MSRDPRARIAVTGLLEESEGLRFTLRTRYLDAIAAAGGLPIPFAPVNGIAQDPDAMNHAIEGFDGLLLTGGDDFRTEPLGLGPTHPEATPVHAIQQEFDLCLARTALVTGLPTLGICYGMQVMALAEGGSLLQHLPEDRPDSRDHSGGGVHGVDLREGSHMRQLFGRDSCQVISRHHQALAAVGKNWIVVAEDDEHLIEGVERAGHPFALGVQWHPELSSEGSEQALLFRGLVAAAEEHARRRGHARKGLVQA